MNTINTRIQEIVDKLFGGKSASFAREIDVKPTTIANYLKSESPSKPTSDFLELVVSKLGVDATWLLTGQGEMQKQPVHVRQDHNQNSTNYGYVNIAVPEKGKQKILNSDGIVIESEDVVSEQLSHYKTMIDTRDEQTSRLLAMIEEKDKTIAKLIEKI